MAKRHLKSLFNFIKKDEKAQELMDARVIEKSFPQEISVFVR